MAGSDLAALVVGKKKGGRGEGGGKLRFGSLVRSCYPMSPTIRWVRNDSKAALPSASPRGEKKREDSTPPVAAQIAIMAVSRARKNCQRSPEPNKGARAKKRGRSPSRRWRRFGFASEGGWCRRVKGGGGGAPVLYFFRFRRNKKKKNTKKKHPERGAKATCCTSGSGDHPERKCPIPEGRGVRLHDCPHIENWARRNKPGYKREKKKTLPNRRLATIRAADSARGKKRD